MVLKEELEVIRVRYRGTKQWVSVLGLVSWISD